MHKDDIALTCGYGDLGEEVFSITVEQYLRMYVDSVTQAVIASSAIEGEVLSDREIEFLHQDSEKRIRRALARLNVKQK